MELALSKVFVEVGGGEEREVLVPQGATIQALIDSRALPAPNPGNSIFLNGSVASASSILREGDVVAIQAKSATQG